MSHRMRRNIIAIIVRPASLRFSLVPPRRSRTLRNHNPNGGGSMRSEGRQGSMLRLSLAHDMSDLINT